jgi:uncharacterized membrane protein
VVKPFFPSVGENSPLFDDHSGLVLTSSLHSEGDLMFSRTRLSHLVFCLLPTVLATACGIPGGGSRPVPPDPRDERWTRAWHEFITHYCPESFFEGIGDLPGDIDEAVANDITADGTRVVGGSDADDPGTPKDGDSADWKHAFQGYGWTRPCEGRMFWYVTREVPVGFGPGVGIKKLKITTGIGGPGIFGLGYPLDAMHLESNAEGVSPDGAVIAGSSNSGNDTSNPPLPILWTAGKPDAYGLLAGDLSGQAREVSNLAITAIGKDRRVIVGFSHAIVGYPNRSHGAKPVYWLNGDATARALAIPTGTPSEGGEATCTSDNGLILAGNLYHFDPAIDPSESHGCAWWFDAAKSVYVPILLQDLAGGADSCHVHGISGNGQIVVGIGTTDQGTIPCFWKRTQVLASVAGSGGGFTYGFSSPQPLTLLAGADAGYAIGANADGSVIGGSCIVGDESKAVLWTNFGSPKLVTDIFASQSIHFPSGWSLDWVSRLSADGKTFIGQGWRTDASDPSLVYYEGWIARVP